MRRLQVTRVSRGTSTLPACIAGTLSRWRFSPRFAQFGSTHAPPAHVARRSATHLRTGRAGAATRTPRLSQVISLQVRREAAVPGRRVRGPEGDRRSPPPDARATARQRGAHLRGAPATEAETGQEFGLPFTQPQQETQNEQQRPQQQGTNRDNLRAERSVCSSALPKKCSDPAIARNDLAGGVKDGSALRVNGDGSMEPHGGVTRHSSAAPAPDANPLNTAETPWGTAASHRSTATRS